MFSTELSLIKKPKKLENGLTSYGLNVGNLKLTNISFKNLPIFIKGKHKFMRNLPARNVIII